MTIQPRYQIGQGSARCLVGFKIFALAAHQHALVTKKFAAYYFGQVANSSSGLPCR